MNWEWVLNKRERMPLWLDSGSDVKNRLVTTALWCPLVGCGRLMKGGLTPFKVLALPSGFPSFAVG
jgi:hypothetical protein